MANRLNAPNTFASLSPPWVLSQLDANATQNQTAWNDSSLGFVNGTPTDTGSANAYTISLPIGSPSAYNTGMTCFFIPSNSNTGASTLTVSPLGSAAILTPAGNALQGGELQKNKRVGVVYNSGPPTGFYIITPCFLSLNLNTGNVTVECAGYDGVSVFNSNTGNSFITLNHVSAGVPLTVTFSNSSGSTFNFGIGINDAGGTGQNAFAVGPGGANFVISSGTFTIATGITYVFCGNFIPAAGSALFIWGGK